MNSPVSRRSILGGVALTAAAPLAGAAQEAPTGGGTVVVVPLFAQIPYQAVAPGAVAIVTAGHRSPGIGAARYLLDIAATDPAAVARRFPLTTALTADGRLFRIDPAGALSALALGAMADGTTDDAPAIQQFLDSLGSVADGGSNTPVTIDFHDRRYRLGAPLRIVQNLVALHAQGATLDGGGRAPGLVRIDHDASVNSPTGVAITGRWFLRGSAGDAVALASAPLFAIGHLHASGIVGDVVRVEGCVGGTVAMIEAYDCKGMAYRETAMIKHYRGGDVGGRRINCINNRVDAVRAFRCAGAWLASESWHASVGRIDVESSSGIGVVIESCLSPSFQSIYEEDHRLAVMVRTMPRVFGADFPVGGALIDTFYTAGALVGGARPCSIEVSAGTGTVVRAGRIGGDVRIGPDARDTRIGDDVELLGRLEDAGAGTRVARRARRIVTVHAGERGADIAFERAEPDDRYVPVVRAIGWTGAPGPGALTARGEKPTRGGFRLELLAAVDAGCTVTFLAEAR